MLYWRTQKTSHPIGTCKVDKLEFGRSLVSFRGADSNVTDTIRSGYIPHDMFSPGGANTKQVSRTLEVSLGSASMTPQHGSTAWI